MPFLELQQAHIHYEFDKSADRPVLVLSNSLGTNLSMWLPQLPQLAKHFSILRYDSRGHGQSSIPPGPYSIEQMGGDVLTLLDELELGHVHFCGLSLGGLVGQWLGIHAPHRFQKLVLSNTAAKIGNELTWNQRIETVRQHGMEAIAPSAIERWLTAEFRAAYPIKVEGIGAMLLSTNAEGYASCCAAVRDTDLREDIRKITLPTLIIFGDQDPVTPADDARFLINNISGARLLELHAAHLSNVEAASAFTQGLIDFLLGADANSLSKA